MKPEQFEKEFTAATKRGSSLLKSRPKADRARFDRKTKRLVIDLQNGATLIVPVDLIQGLKGASDIDLADLALAADGSQIHWGRLDVQMYVESLVNGVFGTRAWMVRLKDHYSAIGSKGGSAKSAVKVAASRENGKRGGRPRKRSLSR